ncbi:hypothetical protein L1987_63019 [Smallanthus sonchifolius]|uniref:Uncharacterized protein n=1 Tax=Smallanthus sonchifolius TaxID=185202 RepID=A0ACB9CC39_9ASTR|nr:hypothetical protein L1987_63019 [Smallanthus sonchifolius]
MIPSSIFSTIAVSPSRNQNPIIILKPHSGVSLCLYRNQYAAPVVCGSFLSSAVDSVYPSNQKLQSKKKKKKQSGSTHGYGLRFVGSGIVFSATPPIRHRHHFVSVLEHNLRVAIELINDLHRSGTISGTGQLRSSSAFKLSQDPT